MAFPTTLPAYTGTLGSEFLGTAESGQGLSGLLNEIEGDVTALGTKMGTGASTPTTGTVLRGNGTGTSVWGDVVFDTDMATFSSSDLAGKLTDETGSGSAVFGTSPTIATPTLTTPTIASFANANHNHTNSAGGGTLGSSAITGIDKSITTTDSNPYKFSVYRSTTQSLTTSGTRYTVQFDSESFDTNNNFDSATNYTYTAPVAGFYLLSSVITITNGSTATFWNTFLYKNGTTDIGSAQTSTTANAGNHTSVVTGLFSLAANDTVVVQAQFGANTTNVAAGLASTYFTGHLVSRT